MTALLLLLALYALFRLWYAIDLWYERRLAAEFCRGVAYKAQQSVPQRIEGVAS